VGRLAFELQWLEWVGWHVSCSGWSVWVDM